MRGFTNDRPSRVSAPKYTRFHALYLAHRLTLRGDGARSVIRSLAGCRIDLRRHQVEAAVFALNSPLSGGVLLADEVGLGKTIEAGLVMAQFCAEQRRRILLIVPPSLQRQWQEELRQKFRLQSELLSSRQLKSGVSRSDDMINEPIIWIVSPGVAARSATFLEKIDWDLIIVDEAHWLRGLWYASPAQRPAALQRLLREHFTLLLSATPIQNSLLDLGALLSLLDQSRFSSAERFRLTYGDRESSPERVAALREAIAPMVSRRLRSEVRNQLKFTRRQVHTLDFTPSAAEKQLYIQISDYLNGPTLAFGTTSKLVLMTARKILGSSTAAIIGFLETVIARLGRQESASLADLQADLEDSLDEEELEEGQEARSNTVPAATAVALFQEQENLRACLALAHAVEDDAKLLELLRALPEVLDAQAEQGGARKAVIFTQSRRTQAYLARRLAEAGFSGILLLNGTNDDSASQEAYARWQKLKGSRETRVNPAADKKDAIIHAFRAPDQEILISTDSGAEGLNLQFCSLLINYDLPWNPQRIEQRIGRCHRYGQQRDVLVINFLNRDNYAESRLYELLCTKFALFTDTLGASDEVLGELHTDIDLEGRLVELVGSGRSREEIDAAFAKLQKAMDEARPKEVALTSRSILDHLDHSLVKELLPESQQELVKLLSTFSQQMFTLFKAAAPSAQFLPDDPESFRYRGYVYSHNLSRLAQEVGTRYPYTGDELVARLIARTKRLRPRLTGLCFDYVAYRAEGHAHLSDVRRLCGTKGWLSLALLTFLSEKGPVDRLIITALPDEGRALHEGTADRLFLLPASPFPLSGLRWPEARMGAAEEKRVAAAVAIQTTENKGAIAQRSQNLQREHQQTRQQIELRLDDLETRAVRVRRRVSTTDRPEEARQELADLLRQVMVTCREGLESELHFRACLSKQEREGHRLLSFKTTLTPLLRLRWEVRE